MNPGRGCSAIPGKLCLCLSFCFCLCLYLLSVSLWLTVSVSLCHCTPRSPISFFLCLCHLPITLVTLKFMHVNKRLERSLILLSSHQPLRNDSSQCAGVVGPLSKIGRMLSKRPRMWKVPREVISVGHTMLHLEND